MDGKGKTCLHHAAQAFTGCALEDVLIFTPHAQLHVHTAHIVIEYTEKGKKKLKDVVEYINIFSDGLKQHASSTFAPGKGRQHDEQISHVRLRMFKTIGARKKQHGNIVVSCPTKRGL